MSLWWLQPGWADARCGNCGAHIQQSGGDPDWGLCCACMDARQQDAQQERDYYAAQEQAYYEALEKDQP